MKNLQKIIRSVSMIGQLGVSIVTPPLVFIYLAHLAEEKLGWGVWVMLVAIVLGIVTAFSSAKSLLSKFLKAEKRDEPPTPSGFNEHQ